MSGFRKISRGKGGLFTLLSGSRPFQQGSWRDVSIWMEMGKEILLDMAENIVP